MPYQITQPTAIIGAPAPTYRAATFGKTLYSTAAAVILELQGSATVTVKILRLRMWAQAGTKFYSELTLQRSTTVSGGTPTALTGRPMEPNDAAATAICNYYEAAATQGTGHLAIGGFVLGVSPPAAAMPSQLLDLNSLNLLEKPITLRGTSDWFAVYNNTTTLGTATYGFELTWTEDNS